MRESIDVGILQDNGAKDVEVGEGYIRIYLGPEATAKTMASLVYSMILHSDEDYYTDMDDYGYFLCIILEPNGISS